MKYMGSKARLAKDILPIILKDRKPDQWYVEPFAGGMNSICEVVGKRLANDIHTPLIKMWEALVSGWDPPMKITRDEYYCIMQNKHMFPEHLVGWVGFNCSYSGKWFGGFAGQTKTKTGQIRDYQSEAIKNVSNQVKKMEGVVFKNSHYYELDIPPNSIIYCDPPYEGTTKYANNFDHNIFWEWARSLSEKGHVLFVSEYNAPVDFECVWQKPVKSSLSANGVSGGNKNSTEKLFIHAGNTIYRDSFSQDRE